MRSAVQYLEEGFDDDYDDDFGAERGVELSTQHARVLGSVKKRVVCRYGVLSY